MTEGEFDNLFREDIDGSPSSSSSIPLELSPPEDSRPCSEASSLACSAMASRSGSGGISAESAFLEVLSVAAGDVRTEDDGRIVLELARASGSPALRKGDFASWAGDREVALEDDPVRALEEGRLAGIVVACEPSLLVHPEGPLKPGQQARISPRGYVERRVMVACPHCGKEIDYRSLKGQVGGKLSGRWQGHTFAGMTISEAAEAYGVSRKTIHAWSKLPPSSAYKRMKRALARRSRAAQ